MTRLRIAYPQLFVADVQRAAEYYRRALGFSIAYLYGEPPFHGLVTRDDVGFNLRFVSLREEPWGATDFIVRDGDGNLLCFASPADRPPRSEQP